MMSWIEVVAVLISIIGVTLTIQRNIACWFFNFIAYLMYAYIFYDYKLYAETVLQIIFLGITVYGLIQWRKYKLTETTITVKKIKINVMAWQLLCTSLAGLGFGLGLHFFTDAALPVLDAQLAALSLLATYWTTQKYIATWLLWIVVDVVYVGMFAYKALYLTAGLYAVFIALAVLGWKQWYSILLNQSMQSGTRIQED